MAAEQPNCVQHQASEWFVVINKSFSIAIPLKKSCIFFFLFYTKRNKHKIF